MLVLLLRRIASNPILFLLLYAVVGVATIPDLGVPLDDYTQYVIGQSNYHILTGEKTISDMDPDMRFYGPAFETFCYAIDSMFYGEPDTLQKFWMRHGLVFLLFTLALFYFYKICYSIWKSKSTAWILLLMLAFCPRIFADAHYNSKDTVFMSLLIIGMYFVLQALQEGKWKWVLLSGVLLGLASTLRLVGFFVIPVLFVVWILHPNYREYWKQNVKRFGLFMLAFLGAYYLFFPALWAHPIQGFAELVHHITHFPWPHYTLLAGQWVGLDRMPWWYFPVWLFYTIPIPYIVVFSIGVVVFLMGIRSKIQNAYLLFFVLFWTLVFSYILVARPNLYDSWRQLQFLIVPYIVICGEAVHRMTQRANARYIVWAMPVAIFLQTLQWHPYQYVYFNQVYYLTQDRGSFDQDYWHLSTMQAMKWIQNKHPKDTVALFTENSNSAWLNAFLIEKAPRNRMRVVSNRADADYEIEPIRHSRPYQPTRNVVFSIVPGKDTICRVIQLKNIGK